MAERVLKTGAGAVLVLALAALELLSPRLGLAATPPTAPAESPLVHLSTVPVNQNLRLRGTFKAEIREYLASPLKSAERAGRTDFEPLLARWERKYGSLAVEPLLAVAREPGGEDSHRYIALMGAARLGGSNSAMALLPLLKDRSWMIRSGALRALSALENPKASEAVLELLHDRALVVRLEATSAVAKLRPPGAVEALLASLEQPENYHHGKAQWVPQAALGALASLASDGSTSPALLQRLRPLLDHQDDPELQLRAVRTLETLTGRNLARGKPLREQVADWKQALPPPLKGT